jgi:hypothetical protein
MARAPVYLVTDLQRRVVGATWDQETRLYRVPVEDCPRSLTRYDQILADVAWRTPWKTMSRDGQKISFTILELEGAG